jgi:uncharacterized membrane protein YcaP (DUF421 family)
METVVRAAIMFAFLWFVTRAAGKATLGEMSSFQLVMYIVLGDLIQQGVTGQDYSVTGAIVAVSVFTVATVGLSWVEQRWPRSRPVVHGAPIVVVSGGEPQTTAMRAERLSIDDLYEAAREKGIERIDQVKLAVLESDGRISFFTREKQDS